MKTVPILNEILFIPVSRTDAGKLFYWAGSWRLGVGGETQTVPPRTSCNTQVTLSTKGGGPFNKYDIFANKRKAIQQMW